MRGMRGQTKDVFALDDGCMLQFKDSVTGADGKIDSRGNEVIGESGGQTALRSLDAPLLQLIRAAGFHPLRAAGSLPNTMVVQAARSYGLEGRAGCAWEHREALRQASSRNLLPSLVGSQLRMTRGRPLDSRPSRRWGSPLPRQWSTWPTRHGASRRSSR